MSDQPVLKYPSPWKWKINAREIIISAKPITITVTCLFSDVAALNNNMPPASPRNSTAVPCITRS